MNKLIVRITVGTAFFALTIGMVNADTWRMSHKMPPESVEGELFQSFADRVAENTDGEIEIEVYPSEQLGSDDAVLEQLQLGTVQVYPEGLTYLQKWVPEFKWAGAPFLFSDREHWVRFMGSDLVQGWFERVEEEAGIKLIGDPTAFVRGPWRVMLSSRDWENLEEMQGIKLRMNPDELAAKAWRHLGAEVRTLSWTETYEALGRDIVTAVNSPIAMVESMRFQEVAPHIVRHNEYQQGMAFMTNADTWNSLEQETRDEVLAAHQSVSEDSAQQTREVALASIERMKEEGVTYTEIDTSAFVERMNEMYQEMGASGELPDGLLDTIEKTREAKTE